MLVSYAVSNRNLATGFRRGVLMTTLAICAAAYVLGSLPTGLPVGRARKVPTPRLPVPSPTNVGEG